MSDDDDDYMSDKFLSACLTANNNNQKPGIITSHTEKRNLQIYKRKQEQDESNRKKNPNIRLLESERRKEGMDKPIDQSNKGFALLQKMGYKAGTSIGKSGSGRVQPIPVLLKVDREGLGLAEEKRENYKVKCKMDAEKQISVSEYRLRITEKVTQKQAENDFRKSQKICERLDVDNGIDEPHQDWYWFSSGITNADTDDKENGEEKDEQLEVGEKIDDVNESDDLQSGLNYVISEETDTQPDIPFSVEDRLYELTTYLRDKYFYCIWCSVKFNDKNDMELECPGRMRKDH